MHNREAALIVILITLLLMGQPNKYTLSEIRIDFNSIMS